jgi:predicted dehydrogenase
LAIVVAGMIKRREFLAGACAMALAGARSGSAVAADDPRLRAVIIGHTGRGGYGHGMNAVFAGREGIEVVAVADADEKGRAAAMRRCGAARGYADYRQMLEKERPALVCVGPRTTTERREMLLAAVGAGAHVMCEKPFVQTPADGDEVLALAEQKGVRIAVAHQMRLAPGVVHLKKRIDDGLIGDLVEMRAWGKQDARAGGEDLLVLGVHLFDLMRMFAGGEPRWCTARVQQGGRDATIADARPATEEIGPVLGDEIEAQFAFDRGVFASFTSRAKLRDISGHWGLELVGSKGSARVLADIWPSVLVSSPAGKWSDTGRTDTWRALEDDPSAKATVAQRAGGPANARVVDDWLAAIREKREPACSGRNAAKAVEMVMAVWRAGLSGGRVALPLTERGHALAKPGA